MRRLNLLTGIAVLALALPSALHADVVIPEASNVRYAVASKGRVNVTYTLSAPAVVTFDIVTNGVSIGAENIFGFDGEGAPSFSGDICREVAAGSRSFVWNAGATWPDGRGRNAQVVVTAWPLDDKPPYMVVDISSDFAGAAADRIRYYEDAAQVPGGITDNPAYKTNAIVFRRIHARWRPFVSGIHSGSRTLTLTNDFYLAVFETTQAQWAAVKGSTPVPLFLRDGAGRPMDNASYCRIREWSNDTQKPEYQYPNPPCPDSYIGVLRSRCGNLLDFDLPSRAQWTFAAIGGHTYGYWGDGSPVTTSGNQGAETTVCPNLDRLGRYASNGGFVPTNNDERKNVADNDLQHGTAIVGTYLPNDYGIYDMHGNVLEWCLDRSAAAPAPPHGDVVTTGTGSRVCMGGDCHRAPAYIVPQSAADEIGPNTTAYSYSRGTYVGFRLACRNGLK